MINAQCRTYMAVSAYPTGINVANISRDTTSKEIISIEYMEKDYFMNQNINTMFGRVNSVEYCCAMLNFPTYEEIDKEINSMQSISAL